ncbi:MAG TPA: DUF2059 domain-containing protein [Bacillota bacterium]|nr:DUF2059 domain-containing protein [Bacillota bacterium]
MKKAPLLLIILVVFIAVFSFGVSVSAQEDTYSASVEKLLVLMNENQLLDQVFQQLKSMQLKQLQQMNISPEQYPIMEKYFTKIYDIIREEMGWEKIKGDFIQIYKSVYSEEDIQQLIDFYESPLGQKVLAKMPFIMEQSIALSQKYMEEILPKIQAVSEEMLIELAGQTLTGE